MSAILQIRDFRSSVMNVEHDGHRLSLKAIETDNFKSIFEEITSMEASASPLMIRKIRQLVKRVAITEQNDTRSYRFIGINSITEEDSDRLVIGITTEENMRALESIPFYTVDSMVEDIISGDSKFVPKAVVDYFLTAGPRVFKLNQYVPIFHFIEKSNYGLDTGSVFLQKFIDHKNEQFDSRLNPKLPANLQHMKVNSPDDVLDLLKSLSPYTQPLVIAHYYDDGILDEDFTMNWIRDAYRSPNRKDVNFKSNLLCALTYVSFKKLGLRNKGGQGPTDI